MVKCNRSHTGLHLQPVASPEGVCSCWLSPEDNLLRGEGGGTVTLSRGVGKGEKFVVDYVRFFNRMAIFYLFFCGI